MEKRLLRRIERTRESLGEITMYKKPEIRAQVHQDLIAVHASFHSFRSAYEGFVTYYGFDKDVDKAAATTRKAGAKVHASA